MTCFGSESRNRTDDHKLMRLVSYLCSISLQFVLIIISGYCHHRFPTTGTHFDLLIQLGFYTFHQMGGLMSIHHRYWSTIISVIQMILDSTLTTYTQFTICNIHCQSFNKKFIIYTLCLDREIRTLNLPVPNRTPYQIRPHPDKGYNTQDDNK